MIKTVITILILSVNLTGILLSQENYKVLKNLTFSSSYDTKSKDRVGLAIEKLGKEIITLSETFNGKGIIAKHNSDGEIIWEKYFEDERINDIKVLGDYIFAVGYKYLKRKVWISKIDSDGNIVWEKLIRFQFENEAEKISVTTSGDIFILCEIQKAWFPIKIRLKNRGMYKRFTFRLLEKDNLENQIGVAKIDIDGNVKWKRKFGKQKNGNHYFAGTITTNDTELIALFYFTQYENEIQQTGTRLIRMNQKGNVFQEYNNSNWMFDVIETTDSDFFTFENNINNHLQIFDTIKVCLVDKDSLRPIKKYISDFDEFVIKSQGNDSLGNIYLAGYVYNFETLGTIWSNHEDIYIAKFDKDLNQIWNFQFNQKNIDRINDIVLIDKELYAIGESWVDLNKRMRLIKIK